MSPSNRVTVTTRPLPVETSYRFKPWIIDQHAQAPKANPNQIVHIKLTMFRNRRGAFIFCALPVPVPPEELDQAADIAAYAERLRKRPTGKLLNVHIQPGSTPFDITLNRQCFVLLELDHRINWRFTPESWGVSKVDNNDHDFGTVFVTNKRQVGPEDDLHVPALYPEGDEKDHLEGVVDVEYQREKEECKILYFSSAARPAGASSQKFNFHIDFHQPYALRDANGDYAYRDGKRIFRSKVLTLIFDPESGNDGGQTYNPPKKP